MPVKLGAHADRLTAVRALGTAKGRRESGRFAFEGPTLLAEARAAGVPIDELYATEAALQASPALLELEAGGTRVYQIDERSARKISDLETPTGIVATARMPEPGMALPPGGVLVLADIGDPGNAGTLLRSAEAFGATGALFGSHGVDPYHPKVVRGAMGAHFRLWLAAGGPDELRAALAQSPRSVIGLAAGGDPLPAVEFPAAFALVVGHERHGLGRWEALCDRLAGIPMHGEAESLNAAVAGSIALYEALKK